MARKGKSSEEIIAVLREAEVRIAQRETVGTIYRSVGISEQPALISLNSHVIANTGLNVRITG
jgi:hypothetical protein